MIVAGRTGPAEHGVVWAQVLGMGRGVLRKFRPCSGLQVPELLCRAPPSRWCSCSVFAAVACARSSYSMRGPVGREGGRLSAS